MQAGQRMGWGASLALALTTTRGAEVDVMAKSTIPLFATTFRRRAAFNSRAWHLANGARSDRPHLQVFL
jgi:hypothetical protein